MEQRFDQCYHHSQPNKRNFVYRNSYQRKRLHRYSHHNRECCVTAHRGCIGEHNHLFGTINNFLCIGRVNLFLEHRSNHYFHFCFSNYRHYLFCNCFCRNLCGYSSGHCRCEFNTCSEYQHRQYDHLCRYKRYTHSNRWRNLFMEHGLKRKSDNRFSNQRCVLFGSCVKWFLFVYGKCYPHSEFRCNCKSYFNKHHHLFRHQCNAHGNGWGKLFLEHGADK